MSRGHRKDSLAITDLANLHGMPVGYHRTDQANTVGWYKAVDYENCLTKNSSVMFSVIASWGIKAYCQGLPP